MLRGLFVFLVAAAALAATEGRAAMPEPTVVFDARALTWEERCTVEALQGLCNRSGPRLYLDWGRELDRRWLDIYAERAGLHYRRVADLAQLLDTFQGDVAGLVVYDPEVDGSRYVAITLAGIERLLPVCPSLLDGTSPALQAGGTPAPLQRFGWRVKHDLRGRFPDSVAAYEWALEALMPRTSRRLAHSVDGGIADGIRTGVCGPMGGFDWQVMRRGFVFNLGAQARKMVSYGAEVGGDPRQAALYERILQSLRAPAEINGYGDPEDYWCALLSRYGHYSFHAFDNWSFHSRVPASRHARRPARRFTPEETTPDPDRYYVCFMTSEGDTMKGPLPFFYGSWFDPARGRVPVNWGINPQMARHFPAMLDYYYATATENDCFFAGCSGAGYCYPDVMPNVDAFARETGAAGRAAGIPLFDLWGAARPATWAQYVRRTRPLGLTTFTGPARLKLLPDGTPVVSHELGYWQTFGLQGESWPKVFADPERRRDAIQRLKARIERIAARVRPPFVILVYGDLHDYPRHASLYAEVAAALDPARFRPARLDEAMSAIRAWARRRVLVGSESINEHLAWAVLEGAQTDIPVLLTNGHSRRVAVRASATLPLRDAGAPMAAHASVTLAAHQALPVTVVTAAPDARPGPTATLRLLAAGQDETLPVDVIQVPGGSRYRHVSLAAVWGSDTLLHPAGEPAADASALRGSAWRSPEPGGRYECLVCGPYSDMPQGRYLAAFRVQRMDAEPLPDDARLLTLEVGGGGFAARHPVTASKAVTASDLPDTGQWRWVLLETDWTGDPDLMETRVYTHGRTRILLDRVVLFRVLAPR